jgi:hypothetical protein
VTACVVSVVAAGCGSAPGGQAADPSGAPPSRGEEQVAPGSVGGVPPVTMTGADGAVDLQPWTYCWTSSPTSGECADGAPPDDLADPGTGSELRFTFPRPGWSFRAVLRPADQPCGRQQDVLVDTVGAQEHLVLPAGPAGSYDVDLFGKGPEGSVAVTVRWTTTVDGPVPVPTASTAVLAEDEGRITSYGVELIVDDLAKTPEQVAATITVTSSEGRALSFDATPVTGECQEEGWIHFAGPDEQGQQAAALGSAPFTYDVDLVLDGRRHTATATWPTDVPADRSPSVPLDFDPPLPALRR